MKLFNLVKLEEELIKESTVIEEESEEIIKQALHFQYLIELLSRGYIDEEILAVPQEDWVFVSENLCNVFEEDNKDISPMAKFLRQNEEYYWQYQSILNLILQSKLPIADDFV